MALNLAKNSAKNRDGISNRLTVPEYLVVDRTEPENDLSPRIYRGLFTLLFASLTFPEVRGIYNHASDAMKSMYDMGDSPSCATFRAIMTCSGSCYRCMSCGSTGGCS